MQKSEINIINGEKENMETCLLNSERLQDFNNYLMREEKSAATVEKYLRDARHFWAFIRATQMPSITKESVLAYKE